MERKEGICEFLSVTGLRLSSRRLQDVIVKADRSFTKFTISKVLPSDDAEPTLLEQLRDNDINPGPPHLVRLSRTTQRRLCTGSSFVIACVVELGN